MALYPMRESHPAQTRFGGFWRVFPLLLVLLIGTEREARAYTDPGTGAMIWQMLVAGFVGAAFYFRRFTTWFKKKGRKD
jgi:nitrate/nitrite transporter NarK